MSSEPRVTVTKEVVKMEDFYPLRIEDLPELTGLIAKDEKMIRKCASSGKRGILFLFRFAIDLLNDLERIRKLKNTFPKDDDAVDELMGFQDIVKEWLEENGGRGNLLRITKALRSNGREEFAGILKQFFLRYSLPLSDKDENGRDNNVYSLSTDFAQEKAKEEGDNVSKAVVTANPSVERALQNSVILEELFKKLQPKEQKTFRMVAPIWMKETLSYWRRSAKLRIEVSENGSADLRNGEKNGITMPEYIKMVQLDRNLQRRKRGKASGSNYDLVKHPFHRYQISYEDCYCDGDGTPFFSGAFEKNFWELCGSQIEDLQIDDARFESMGEDKNLYKICERLLLNTCQNLKKLKISDSCDTIHNLTSSDSDSEMKEINLANKKQDKRKAITRKLKALKLTITKDEDLQGERKWFTDLSSLSFPKLTSLKLCIDWVYCLISNAGKMTFDFRTLEGMRMLEQLEIKAMHKDAAVRSAGTQDWICEGDRTSYLPNGVTYDYSDDPILCNNLKEFTFSGWGLNREDMKLVSGWFPNLTQLVAKVYPEDLPALLDKWEKLDKIEIETEKLISLRELRSLKEKKKHLRIIQRISWCSGRYQSVELKEDSGRLYFVFPAAKEESETDDSVDEEGGDSDNEDRDSDSEGGDSDSEYGYSDISDIEAMENEINSIRWAM